MTVTNMLSILMDKLDNLQKQMGSVRREMEVIRNKQTSKINAKDTISETIHQT